MKRIFPVISRHLSTTSQTVLDDLLSFSQQARSNSINLNKSKLSTPSPIFHITSSAQKRLEQLAEPTKIPWQDSEVLPCLRLAVVAGGCHGFQYMFSQDRVKLESSAKIHDGQGSVGMDLGQEVLFGDGLARLVVDKRSLEVCNGSTLDYTRELIGEAFTVINNPKAAGAGCGCGVSFDVV